MRGVTESDLVQLQPTRERSSLGIGDGTELGRLRVAFHVGEPSHFGDRGLGGTTDGGELADG